MLWIFVACSTLALVTLVGMGVMWRFTRRLADNLSLSVDVIYFFVCYKVFVYWYLSAWFRFINDYNTEFQEGVDISLLVMLYALEFLSYWVWAIVLYLFLKFLRGRVPFPQMRQTSPMFLSDSDEQKVFVGIGLTFLFLTGTKLMSAVGWTEVGSGGLIEVLYGPLVRGVGIVIGPFLMLTYYKSSKPISLLGALITLVTLAW
jgi:hypothetical protein